MMIPKIILGIIVLILGRQIFWLFVAAIGFVIGISFAEFFFLGLPIWKILLIAFITGLLGALLAILLKKLAIGLVGFMTGGYICIWLFMFLPLKNMPSFWLSFFIGGLIGFFLSVILIDWALIILSSLTGAILIMSGFHLNPILKMLLFLVLFNIGIVTQRKMKTKD